MARHIVGSILNDLEIAGINNNFLELYNDLGTATGTKQKLEQFLNGSGVVTNTMLADDSVDGNKIAESSIFSPHLRLGAVGERELATGGVSSSKIRNDAVNETKIQNGAVTNLKIADNSIGNRSLMSGGVFSENIADYAIRSNHLGGGAVNSQHIADNAIGNRTLMNSGVFSENIANWAIKSIHMSAESVGESHLQVDSVGETKIKDGAVSPEKANFDALKLNSGRLYPLINFSLDGTEQTYTQKVLDSILDVKISGATYGKVYQLDSVRNNLSGNYGVRISSFDSPIDGNLDSSTRQTEIDLMNEDVQVVTDYESSPNIMTIISKSIEGLSASVTIDTLKTGFITNLAENSQGYAFGTIIHPANYSYSQGTSGGGVVANVDEKVYVDKTLDDMKVYVPSIDGYYTGYHMYRYTQPYEAGVRWSNSDLWAINRISLYSRNGNEFMEDPNNVFVYSSTNTTTMDTIFRLTGETDYSGGFYHGDEILDKFEIFIGNQNVTEASGQFNGDSLEIMQHTQIYEDTITAGAMTEPYLKVKKAHIFNKESGYTLKSRLEFIKEVSVEFSNPGALSMPRTDTNGNPNFIRAIDMNNMESHDIAVTGALATGDNINQWKFIGDNRDVIVTMETDSAYSNTWLRNSETDTKMYSRIIPQDSTVTVGETFNTSVNYKFNSYK